MSTHEVPDVLRVDGFRSRQSFGFGTLSRTATIAIAAALAFDGIIGSQAPSSLLVSVPATLVVAGLAAARRHGMSALSYYWARTAWKRASRADATSYRQMVLPQPLPLDLVGVGAVTSLVAAHDPTTGRQVGVVHDRVTDRMAVTTLLAPGGSLMAPTHTVASGIRTWSAVLDSMSTDEQIKGASVTIQITPGAGEALGDDVARRRREDAPKLALDTIDELVRTTPRATAQVAPWMTVIVDPTATANPPTDLAEKVAEALRVADSLDLSGTGTDIIRRATATDLRRLVRSAYDPDSYNARAEDFEALQWGECGPTAADDGWAEYVHDGAVSIVSVLREMPRRPIAYSALLPFLSPGRYQRRVTLCYRVLDPHEGEQVLEREISHAEQRAQSTAEFRGRSKHSQRADYQRAEKAASQAASGSQVVEWTLLVTTTARTPADLPGARQEHERAIKATRGIRMRPAFGAQGAMFAAQLPIGYHPLVK